MMKKQIALFLPPALIAAAFAGCAGTPAAYYSDCTCPTGSHAQQLTDADLVSSVTIAVGGSPELIEKAVR